MVTKAIILGGAALAGYYIYKQMAPAPVAAAPAQKPGLLSSLFSAGSELAAGIMASSKKSSKNPQGYQATKEDIAQLEGSLSGSSLAGYSIVGGTYGSLG